MQKPIPLSQLLDRRAIQQQVFRPGHIQPTYTIEQAGEIEHQIHMRQYVN